MIKNVAKMLKKIMLNANSGRNIRFSTRQTPKGTFLISHPRSLGRSGDPLSDKTFKTVAKLK